MTAFGVIVAIGVGIFVGCLLVLTVLGTVLLSKVLWELILS